MTVRSQELRDGVPIKAAPIRPPRRELTNKIVAAIIWLAGALANWSLYAVMVPAWPIEVQIAASALTQVILSRLERPAFDGRPNGISLLALLFDMLLNAGGIFPYAQRAAELPAAQMLATTFSLDPTVPPLGALAISLLLGFLIAAAPESVWYWRD